jgi:hypothetical protein
VKIRTRRFEGRCARHKNYNPAVDERGSIPRGCSRCALLADIWETSLKLNSLIRRFNPKHDDLRKPAQLLQPEPDPRQMSLLDA